MRIAIIGAGSVGRALAAALGKRHAITFGVRSPDGPVDGHPALTSAEAAAGADVVILATPWTAAIGAVQACRDLTGKVLIDATNPLEMGPAGLRLALGFDTSGAEQIAAAAPGARVVKSFNQTGANNMAGRGGYAPAPVMFVAGDDPAARATALTLVSDAGFRGEDAGPLTAARLLEPLAMLWISRAFGGAGRDWTFTLAEREPRP